MFTRLNLFFISGLIIFSAICSYAQTTVINGIINHYTVPLAYDSCAGIITVADTAGFRPSGKMLVLHMQGVQVNITNNAQFGIVTNMQQAGRYEVAEIVDRTATTLSVIHRLKYPLLNGEIVQLVTFPEYNNVVVADTVRPLPWDGQKGGVVAFLVKELLTLNAPVVVDGMGFRGGVSYIAPANNCTWLLGESGYVYALGNWRGGTKGEGIAVGQANLELGRGSLANAGGGGNDHNSGGGGGANTTAGGQGGQNNEPSTFGCDGSFPGLGGRAANMISNRIFMGGGGGAGHANNTFTSDGGNGGGIIFIEAGNINGSNVMISANGMNGQSSDGDGGGGGGAGGSVWLKMNSIPPTVIISANGGNGGNSNASNTNRCFGPGGGASGGCILSNATVGNLWVQPGIPGGVVASTNGCNGSSSGATGGQSGLLQALPILPEGEIAVLPPAVLAQPSAQTVCDGNNAFFNWSTNPLTSNLQWQVNTGNGWANISGETSNSLLLENVGSLQNANTYRCILDGTGCYYEVSEIAQLTVLPVPVSAFTATPTGTGIFVFSNQSQYANGVLWDFGDGATSTEENPVHSYSGNGIFEVELTVWNACDTVTLVQEIAVALPAVAGFTVADTTSACGIVNVQFVNTSFNTQDFQWSFPGGVPFSSTDENPTISYTNSGTYMATLIASNSNGSSNITYSFVVASKLFPVAAFSTNDLTGGTAVQFNFTGASAIIYSWDFGDGSPNSNEEHPVHLFPVAGTYPIRLTVINACGASVLEQVITVVDESNGTNNLMGTSAPLLIVWPMPAHGFVQVYANTGDSQIRIFDVAGREIYTKRLPDSNLLTIDIKDFPEGTYFLQSGRLTKQIIKQ